MNRASTRRSCSQPPLTTSNHELADNVPALYANIRAFNRWMLEEVGYVADGRMFLPPYIALAEPELAVKELEQVIAGGPTIFQTKSGHAHGGSANPFGGRSPADPVYDRFWSIANEADIRWAVHLGGTDYQKYGADWSEDPEAVFGDFDAFQWMMYWGDRPAMELVAAPILHNFLAGTNMKVPLGDGHQVWLPHPPKADPRSHGAQGEMVHGPLTAAQRDLP
jgi:hypothetical protein